MRRRLRAVGAAFGCDALESVWSPSSARIRGVLGVVFHACLRSAPRQAPPLALVPWHPSQAGPLGGQ